MSETIQPIEWIAGGGSRNQKINATVTELVRQAVLNGHRKYGRSSIEKAVRVMAEVGDPSTIDSYIEDICSTKAISASPGGYIVTEEGRDRYKEERGHV